MQYLQMHGKLPAYMIYPRYLLGLELGDTAKLVYVVLLDRGRLSMRNKGWEDEHGHVYIYYPIADLANTLHVSDMSIKRALKNLEEHGMIHRVRQGVGKANRIYIRIPDVRQPNNVPIDGTKISNQIGHKWSGNNKCRGNYNLDDYYDDGGMSL